MDNYLHRQYQNLEQIGPVYSSKDEKQRVIAENIRNLKIKSHIEIKINRNIPGLDKKKVIGSRNPATFRLYTPLSFVSRKGVRYLWTQPNIQRFAIPLSVFAVYYYILAQYIHGTYIRNDLYNYETDYCYNKLSLHNGHFIEKFSLMA